MKIAHPWKAVESLKRKTAVEDDYFCTSVHLILKVSLIVAHSQTGIREMKESWSATQQAEKLAIPGECKGEMISHEAHFTEDAHW